MTDTKILLNEEQLDSIAGGTTYDCIQGICQVKGPKYGKPIVTVIGPHSKMSLDATRWDEFKQKHPNDTFLGKYGKDFELKPNFII